MFLPRICCLYSNNLFGYNSLNITTIIIIIMIIIKIYGIIIIIIIIIIYGIYIMLYHDAQSALQHFVRDFARLLI